MSDISLCAHTTFLFISSSVSGQAFSLLMSEIHSFRSSALFVNTNWEPVFYYFKWGNDNRLYANSNPLTDFLKYNQIPVRCLYVNNKLFIMLGWKMVKHCFLLPMNMVVTNGRFVSNNKGPQFSHTPDSHPLCWHFSKRLHMTLTPTSQFHLKRNSGFSLYVTMFRMPYWILGMQMLYMCFLDK